MSVLFAGGVATAYVAAVVGIHRLNVYRRRRTSGGFPVLRWLDWDELLRGLLPEAAAPGSAPYLGGASTVVGGGPEPAILSALGPHAPGERLSLLRDVVHGVMPDALEERIEAAGFSGGERRWVRTLAFSRHDPERAIHRLEDSVVGTARELYLREYLRLRYHTHALNLELSVFSTKKRLAEGLARFGEVPALFFVRALASAELGFNSSAVDELARAVYFSQQSVFYLRAVLETPFIEELRPALTFQCRQALAAAQR